jgi:hypothetical protein
VARSLLDRPPQLEECTLSVLAEGSEIRLVWDDDAEPPISFLQEAD